MACGDRLRRRLGTIGAATQVNAMEPEEKSLAWRAIARREEEANVIDEHRIKDLIDNCPSDSLEIDHWGIIDDDQLSEYIDLCAASIIEATEDNLVDTMKKRQLQEAFSASTQDSIAVCALFMNFVADIFNHFIDLADKQSPKQICVSGLMKNVLDAFHGYLSLLLVGRSNAAFAQVRMIYEAYVLMRFIQEHPELAEAYLDHSIMGRHRMLKSLSDQDTTQEEDVVINRLLEKYGQSFREDYGWTATVVERRRDRHLRAIAEKMELEGYRPIYVFASDFLHVSSFSVQARDSDGLDSMREGMTATAIELLTNSIIYSMDSFGAPESNRILLMNIIYALRENLLNKTTARELYGE